MLDSVCMKARVYVLLGLSVVFFSFCSSLHCFEGPEWLHLKRGREQFARGPLVKVDPQGRCGGVLVYDLQMIILKATQVYYPLYFCQFKNRCSILWFHISFVPDYFLKRIFRKSRGNVQLNRGYEILQKRTKNIR